MKIYLNYVIVCLLLVMATLSCSKNEKPDTPDDPIDRDTTEVTPPDTTAAADFVFETLELTQGSFKVRIIPEDRNATYYFGLITAEDWKSTFSEDGEVLQQSNLDWFGQLAESEGMSLEQLLLENLVSGEQKWPYFSLSPATDYVFYAYGISTEGKSLTGVNLYEFATPQVQFQNVKFAISASDITANSMTVNVVPDDTLVFYYYDMMPESTYDEYCGSDPELIPAFIENYLATVKASENFAGYTMPEFIYAMTVRGESTDSQSFIDLIPESAYYAFAVGVANDGTAYTDASVEQFYTNETPRNEYEIVASNISDVGYTASISASQDENFAVMLERAVYFSEQDTDKDIIESLMLANGNDISQYIYSRSANVEFTRLIPDEDYILLIFACSPDGSPKLEDGKINLMKENLHTAPATPSDADFSINIYDVEKTSAVVNVNASSRYSAETFLFNYMTKEEYESIVTQVDYFGGSVEEELQSLMDEFIDSSLEKWNSTHGADGQMDRKEYLSRSLMDDAGMYADYDLTGLEPGTEYVVYLFGMKADGTFTTDAVTEEFETVAEEKTLATLTFDVAATDETSERRTLYAIWGTPGGSYGCYYTKTFIDNDEWSGKSADEIVTLLEDTGNRYKYSSATNITVGWGSTWYCYAVCLDTQGIPTDVYRIVHTVSAENGEGGANYEFIDFDLTTVL